MLSLPLPPCPPPLGSSPGPSSTVKGDEVCASRQCYARMPRNADCCHSGVTATATVGDAMGQRWRRAVLRQVVVELEVGPTEGVGEVRLRMRADQDGRNWRRRVAAWYSRGW
jgi:hypothetical protein